MDIKKSKIGTEIIEDSVKKLTKNSTIRSGFQQLNIEKKSPGNANKFSKTELELLNLVAELIVEIILKETKNECDRICED
jgi:hypothetical protein